MNTETNMDTEKKNTSKNSFFREVSMVEDTGWRTLLEKSGLHQPTDILENYGNDSVNDVSELEKGVKVSPF